MFGARSLSGDPLPAPQGTTPFRDELNGSCTFEAAYQPVDDPLHERLV
jgi:hypothetical protein